MGIDYTSFKESRICHDGTLLEGGPLTANALSEISNLETFKKRYDAQPRCAIIVGAGRGHGNRLKGSMLWRCKRTDLERLLLEQAYPDRWSQSRP
jgi:hypothetical protein